MEKLEKKVQNLGKKARNRLTVAALVGALAFGNGCAFNTHTKKENLWFGAATVAHTAEVATHIYALNNGYRELNPLWGKNPSTEKILLIKTAYLGLTYGLGEAYPEHRSTLYKVSTVAGALPTVWNLFQILFTSPKK